MMVNIRVFYGVSREEFMKLINIQYRSSFKAPFHFAQNLPGLVDFGLKNRLCKPIQSISIFLKQPFD